MAFSAAGRWLVTGGDAAEALLSRDWSATPLGPVETWPAPLSQTVKLVVAQPSAMMLLWGPDLLVFCNDALARLADWSAAQVQGRPLRELDDACWARHEESCRQVRHDGQPRIHQQHQDSPTCGRLPAATRVAYGPVTGDDGQVLGVLVSLVHDPHEQVMAQEARRQEQFVQRILDSLPAHVAVLDQHGVIEAVNASWLRFAQQNGNPPLQVVGVGANYLDVCRRAIERGESDVEAVLAGIQAVLAGRPEFRVEYPCHAPGTHRWFVMHVTRPVDRGGAIVTHTDITQAKLVEAELRHSEEMLRQAAAVAGVGIFVHDHDHDVVHWSDSVRRMWRVEAQTPASIERFLKQVHPDDREYVAAAIRRAHDPSGDGVYRVEHRICWPDGSVHWSSQRSQTFFERRGAERRPVRTVGAVVDITPHKEIEERLRQVNEALESRVQLRTAELDRRARQLVRLTNELTLAEDRERRRLAQVLHDHIQQLLAGAKLSLDLAGRRDGDQRQAALRNTRTLLDESIQACRSLAVDLSPPILYDAGLAAGLGWLARWMNKTHGLEVELRLQEGADVTRHDLGVLLFQGVRELLFNVVKHAGVRTARVEVSKNAQHELVIVVQDDGVGFDPAKVALDQKTEAFGLFSIRERLGLLGGRMQIDSSPGQGTCFTLWAPLDREPEGAVRAAEPMARALSVEAAHVSPARARIRVLLADDHSVVREGLSMLLAGEPDIQIVGSASDGTEAVQKTRELHPDVVLMDFTMPGMDGVQATRTIHEEMPQVRVIGLSMYDHADRAAEMLSAGASAYLTKSGESDRLVDTIRRSLGRVT